MHRKIQINLFMKYNMFLWILHCKLHLIMMPGKIDHICLKKDKSTLDLKN